MRFLGQLKHGKISAPDDFDEVDPDILSENYGVDREERHLPPGQSGAGHSDDEDEDAGEGEGEGGDGTGAITGVPHGSPRRSAPVPLDEAIAASQNHHIRHDPIPVPDNRCPFPEGSNLLEVFIRSLNDVRAAGIIPHFVGVRELEWPEDGYGTYEFIALGRRGRRVSVELPFDIWWPRAVAWSQGLDIMNRILNVMQ